MLLGELVWWSFHQLIHLSFLLLRPHAQFRVLQITLEYDDYQHGCMQLI